VHARLHPSILAADFANFERELSRITTADMVHVDVMDNHFVPNLTFGLPMVKRLVEVSPVPLDVHLMIENPDRWAVGYAEAGAASVTISVEAAQDPVAIARGIREAGAKAAIAVKPGTDIEPYLATLEEWDMILVMTVEPGFGGQSFQPEMMPKVRRAAEAIAASGLDIRLQVDGGIASGTIAESARHGADTFVAGSAVYGSDDPERAIAELRAEADAAISTPAH
jgi:ribulose-phosphate 3-epimerase